MVFKLLGPRRRTSGRIRDLTESHTQNALSATGDANTPHATSGRRSSSQSNTSSNVPRGRKRKAPSIPTAPQPDSPPGDNIQVRQRLPIEISDDDNSTGGEPRRIAKEDPSSKATNATPSAEPNRPWSCKGKGPARPLPLPEDLPMTNASEDEQVEEYDFSNEPEYGDENDEDEFEVETSGTAANNVIMISSDDEGEKVMAMNIDDRPWRKFERQHRIEWEKMYCAVTDYPIHDSWHRSEDYMREKDAEMFRYLEDFPLPTWLIVEREAQAAYERLRDRARWRGVGQNIYELREGIPEHVLHHNNHRMPHHSMQPTLPPARGQYVRHQMPVGHQSYMAAHMPLNVPPGRNMMHRHRAMPPPPVLPSQPVTMPGQWQPNGLSYAQQPPLPGAAGFLNAPHGYNTKASAPSQTTMGPPRPVLNGNQQKGKANKHKASTPQPPPPPPSTPPYETRKKPAGQKSSSQKGRRRAGELLFPWNRQGLDFQAAKANATWDDSMYDPTTLAEMEKTRAKNEPIVEEKDEDEAERQRLARTARMKMKKFGSDDNTTAEQKRKAESEPDRRLGKAKIVNSSNTGDPLHFGNYCFVESTDQEKALKLGKKTPDDVISAVGESEIKLEDCGDIMICWNAGKRDHVTETLEPVRFSIKDVILTRRQLENTPVLTYRAAERVVDFCPDMLWREMLLRITSETSYGNKDLRDRMCWNGSYYDKATITKRIGAALGRKQVQPASRRRLDPESGTSSAKTARTKDEDDYYNANVKDLENYINFFGKRSSHRAQLQHHQAMKKQKALLSSEGNRSFGAENGLARSSKSAPALDGPGNGPGAESSDEGGDTTDPDSDDEGGDGSVAGSDAVSVQSDTVLDELDLDE